jgi:hypothetical protein
MKQSLAGPASAARSIIRILLALKPESLFHSLDSHFHSSQLFNVRFLEKNCHTPPASAAFEILIYSLQYTLAPFQLQARKTCRAPKNMGSGQNGVRRKTVERQIGQAYSS